MVPSKAVWETHFLLEYYMRCDRGSIQDKMPEGADLRNIIILYNMPLSNSQRHSQVFTTLPSIFILCRREMAFQNSKKIKVIHGDESKPTNHFQTPEYVSTEWRAEHQGRYQPREFSQTLKKLTSKSSPTKRTRDPCNLPLSSIFFFRFVFWVLFCVLLLTLTEAGRNRAWS